MIANQLRNIRKEYDLIIVGGGIYGATLLWEASLKGLSAILVEKEDFCSGTSANSLKIIHGGLRYLQEFDIKRIRESAKELDLLIKIAPHLVQPLACIIPTCQQFNKSKIAMAIALKLYGLISPGCLKNNKKSILHGRIISKNEFCDLVPISNTKGITGGALWYDALNYNSERLALEFVFSAIALGSDALNYLECQELIVRKKCVLGIRAYDKLLKKDVEIYGKIVVNTTGPWTNQICRQFSPTQSQPQFHFAKAVNLIIPRTLSTCAFGLKATSPSDDYSKRNRFLFFVPWRGATMIGTWYFNHHVPVDDIILSKNEFDRCIQQVKHVFPEANIDSKEVCFIHLGLVPVDLSSNKKDFQLRRHHCLIDHGCYGGPDMLLSVLGVKYTTARHVSAQIIELVAKKLNRELSTSGRDCQLLYGGGIENVDRFIQEKKNNNRYNLTGKIMRHLAFNYGANYKRIEELISDDVELGNLIPGSDEAIKAELLYCLKNEFVYHLSDFILRRTGIGSLKKPEIATINFCAEFMAKELDWTESHKNEEINALIGFYDKMLL